MFSKHTIDGPRRKSSFKVMHAPNVPNDRSRDDVTSYRPHPRSRPSCIAVFGGRETQMPSVPNGQLGNHLASYLSRDRGFVTVTCPHWPLNGVQPCENPVLSDLFLDVWVCWKCRHSFLFTFFCKTFPTGYT